MVLKNPATRFLVYNIVFQLMTEPNALPTSPDYSIKDYKKMMSFLPRIFSSRRCNGGLDEDDDDLDAFGNNAYENHDAFSGVNYSAIERLDFSEFDQTMAPQTEIRELRVFVATWNVGGKTPAEGLNLEDFLLMEGSADLYICGFQEIVPLSAGNVLVMEEKEPASKWLALIHRALNYPRRNLIPGSKPPNTLNLSHKQSLKALTKSIKVDATLVKTCSCSLYNEGCNRGRDADMVISDFKPKYFHTRDDSYLDGLASFVDVPPSPWTPGKTSYRLVAKKQMVGIFLSVWVRKQLVPHIAHLRISSVGRGILGYLGNKGCISISMSVHQTTFCFVCSHLASGEKEGDELRRNADVAEILKNTVFPTMCRNSKSLAPETIVDHDRVIWLGDLNYRVVLSYEETRLLMEDNDWNTLLENDQLNIEREAGRVFTGFKEGRISFAPTYKYSHNSDSYAGTTAKSRKKRRTPAWCDRILWRGNGMEQLSYVRGETRFSDHRPVCAVFAVEVDVLKKAKNNRFRVGYSCTPPSSRHEFEDCIPQRHSFYD